jgi:hypothetical protein
MSEEATGDVLTPADVRNRDEPSLPHSIQFLSTALLETIKVVISCCKFVVSLNIAIDH